MLPGLFIAFCRTFDLENTKNTHIYHKVSFIGYILGLISCVFCLSIFQVITNNLFYNFLKLSCEFCMLKTKENLISYFDAKSLNFF